MLKSSPKTKLIAPNKTSKISNNKIEMHKTWKHMLPDCVFVGFCSASWKCNLNVYRTDTHTHKHISVLQFAKSAHSIQSLDFQKTSLPHTRHSWSSSHWACIFNLHYQIQIEAITTGGMPWSHHFVFLVVIISIFLRPQWKRSVGCCEANCSVGLILSKHSVNRGSIFHFVCKYIFNILSIFRGRQSKFFAFSSSCEENKQIKMVRASANLFSVLEVPLPLLFFFIFSCSCADSGRLTSTARAQKRKRKR